MNMRPVAGWCDSMRDRQRESREPASIETDQLMDILHAVGNTSMVRLRKVVPPKCADVFVKLEWENPTGSVKDRMAHAVISRAAAGSSLDRLRLRRAWKQQSTAR